MRIGLGLRLAQLVGAVVSAATNALLLEDATYLLLEDGTKLLLEA